MTIAQIVSLSIQLSMSLMVFSVGLRARPDDVLYLLRRPSLLARSLLSMHLVMPAIAVGIALTLDLNPALEIALIALAVSPVPPILPPAEIKAGGRPSYVVGLLALTAVVSIVFVPAAALVIGRLFDREVHTAPAAIAWIVATSVLAPLLLGIVVGRLARSLSARIARPLALVSTIGLVVAFLPVLVRIWPSILASFGNFSLLTIAVFAAAGLGVGHLFAGPAAADRKVLASATASRHPAVALAVAHNSPELPVVLGTVLVALVTASVLTKIYVRWIHGTAG